MRGLSEARRRERSSGPPVFVPGWLHGLRRWTLQRGPQNDLRLGGYGSLWRAGGETTWAECRRRELERAHPAKQSAPVGSCTCGLHAWHPWATITETAASPRTFAMPAGPPLLEVVGIVEAWGTVHVHREGFRAQYARPVSLALIGTPRSSEFGRLVEGLAISHRARLLEFTEAAGLVDHCKSAGIGIPRSTVESLLRGEGRAGIRVDGSG